MPREDEQYSDEERDQQEQIQEENDNGLKRKREDDDQDDSKKQKYDYDARAAYTVMLRNLSYNTSDDSIKEKLSKYGSIVRVNIPTDERGRSRGYGFVEFEETDAAQKVVDLKAMELDGREVQLQQSKARDEFSGRTTQVFVGNLPETAEEQDVRELFESCGEIDEVRMPKDKDTEKKKGFAFVQFRDSTSVKAALEKDGTEFKGVSIRVNEEKSTRNKQRRDRFDDRRGGRGGGDRRGGRGGNRRFDDRRGGGDRYERRDDRRSYDDRRGGGDDRRGGGRSYGGGDDRRGDGGRRYERR